MSEDKNLELFRQGFCEKAAELGVLPSELLAYSGYKQALDLMKPLGWVSEKLVDAPLQIGAAGLLLGLGGGALGNYLYNKTKFELDPDDTILPEYGVVDEAKKLHLLAKYRNAKKMVEAGLS